MSMFGDAASVVGGLINNGRRLPTVDISSLLNTINNNQSTNNALVNGMPAEMQKLIAAYQAQQNQGGNTLQTNVNQIGQNLLDQTKANYDPNSPAVQATLAALKQQDYSTLPGTVNALKSQLAGSGGLANGGAARAITSAVLAPASAYSGQAATVQGQQLQQQQQNVQAALNKIASMDDTTAQQIFGMTTQQATQILQSGRQDLQTQLADLINNNNTATQQTLGAEGVAVNNAYQNGVTRNAQQGAIVNGLVNLGADAGQSLFSGGAGASGGGAAFPQGSTDMTVPLPNPASNVPGYGSGSGLNLY